MNFFSDILLRSNFLVVCKYHFPKSLKGIFAGYGVLGQQLLSFRTFRPLSLLPSGLHCFPRKLFHWKVIFPSLLDTYKAFFSFSLVFCSFIIMWPVVTLFLFILLGIIGLPESVDWCLSSILENPPSFSPCNAFAPFSSNFFSVNLHACLCFWCHLGSHCQTQCHKISSYILF